ncbi:penicillin-binding transpeptidase domain-containing protein [Streptomyces collinus]|uniref:Secreted penicillin-binding protein n=1 Tax=Streptomyces collinus (strain DSM 40733 / Tue 365) TaxID=1214242 RepID=S5UU16_STRC3|nr:penicillin-binding transpeptidase domain-containing protein [Streptomyces collinus]AGS70678.1 secreted penicillin-binding protein [Streptomyces collinus Tu 365]UJA09323.1 penicillin-binding protein 2 [Streptomyces collinus]UJA15813.1 penicillin-binding protein 2 [Streptomyces collinus]
MNKPLRRIAIFCGLLVLALLIRDNYLQYVRADQLSSEKDNRRVAIERYANPRGDIIVDGNPITGSVESKSGDFKYKRTYKNGPMWAPVTGYSSQAFDGSQLEKLNDGILTGNDDRLFFRNTLDMITGKPRQGGNVVTTLNAAAQKAAFDGLKSRGGKGAVVALEPSTGKILALASYPSYNPSSFAGNTNDDAKAWNKLQKKNDPADPMLNRALRETYPPGSTFKVVTAAAALENGKYNSADEPTDSPQPWIMTGTHTELKNEGSIRCKNVSMREALRISCNTVFGKIGADLGNDKMLAEAKKFGFDSEQFTPVRSNASVFSDHMNDSQTALSSIGQYNTAATPLQMAMVASAVANDGRLMKPYMVDELQSSNVDPVSTTDPQELSRPLSPKNAQVLQQMMETVVKDGTGKNAQIGGGVTVGGKTGTAQHGVANSANPYAWFISYAKLSDGSSPVAVAVVVEDENANRDDISGGGLAAPIAKNVMEAVINSKK